jgi:hypothetical protein
MAMALSAEETFRGYDGRLSGGVYDRRDIAEDEPVEMHALFCYG